MSNSVGNSVASFSHYVQSFNKGEKVNNLFALNFAIMATNSLLMPVRESLTLEGGKQLQTRLMMLTVIVSMGGQAIFSYYSGKNGGLYTLRSCFMISSLSCIATYCCLIFAPSFRMIFSSTFYLWFTFYNMTSMSTFWAIAGDVIEEPADAAKGTVIDKPRDKKIGIFSHLAAGGTLGHMAGSSLSTILLRKIGSKQSLLVLSAGFFFSISLCARIQRCKEKNADMKKSSGISVPSTPLSNKPKDGTKKFNIFSIMLSECYDQIQNVGMIWDNPILRYSVMYTVLLSTSLGLTVIERTISAKASGLSADEYANVLAHNQTLHGALQFIIQFFGSGAMIAAIGSVAALSASGVARFLSFVAIFYVQAQFSPSITTWHASQAVIPVTFVIIADLLCRLTTQTISKPVRESLWVYIPKENKYRSKIIVDVLAHRIGTSMAAFLANVPILRAVNHILLSSPLFTQVYRTVTGLDGVVFKGFIGQDHIVWGLLATSLLCYTALCLGFAVVKVKDKTD